jgi:hypothetical protein
LDRLLKAGEYKDEAQPVEATAPAALLADSLRWEDDSQVFERLLVSTLKELREMQANIVIVASVPEVGRNVPLTLARAAVSGIPSDVEVEPGDFSNGSPGRSNC